MIVCDIGIDNEGGINIQNSVHCFCYISLILLYFGKVKSVFQTFHCVKVKLTFFILTWSYIAKLNVVAGEFIDVRKN